MPRGGRRPGAGAPKGNLNGLATGAHSRQLQALQGALTAMPMTTDLLVQITGRDRHKMEVLATALHYYADMLLAVASGNSIKGLDHTQLHRLALASDPIKELRNIQIPETRFVANPIKQSKKRHPGAGVPADRLSADQLSR